MSYYKKKKVALIMRDAPLRQLLSLLIRGEEQYNLVIEAENHDRLISQVQKQQPDFIIVDLHQDNNHDTRMIHAIRKRFFKCMIMVLSEYANPEFIFDSFRAGANGYILKKAGVQFEILARLHELSLGGAPMSSCVSRMVVESFHVSRQVLSRREVEVLELLMKGETYRKISKSLLISAETAKTHIRNIYAKLKVNNKSEAIAKALAMRIASQTRLMSSAIDQHHEKFTKYVKI